MAQNIIDTQMNVYSMNIRRKIIARLKRSEEHGQTIDKEFENHLINEVEVW